MSDKVPKTPRHEWFNQVFTGEGGFLDRDLYVFCGNISDGLAVAIGNPNAKQLLGADARTLKDATGKPFGEELYAAYQNRNGEITEVNYMFPRPGADKTPVPKVSLVTRVGDIGLRRRVLQVESLPATHLRLARAIPTLRRSFSLRFSLTRSMSRLPTAERRTARWLRR